MADNGLKRQILTQEQMTEFIRELRTGDRILSVKGDEGNYRLVILKKPTKQNELDARVFYSALYSSLLKNGIPTRAEARQEFLLRLKNTGINTEDYEKRKDEIQSKLAEHLSKEMDEEQADKVLESLPELLKALDRNLRTLDKDELELLHIMADNEAMEAQIMSNCAEAIADAETQMFFMAQIAYNSDGTLVWPNPDALANETDLTFLLRMREEFTRYRNGFPLLFEVVVPTQEDLSPKEYPSS